MGAFFITVNIEPLVYGGKIEFDYKGIPVKYYDNKVVERLKSLRRIK